VGSTHPVPATALADGPVPPTSLSEGGAGAANGVATGTNGDAAALSPRLNAARSDGMAAHDPNAATAMPDLVAGTVVPVSDQPSTAQIAAGAAVDISAGVAATAPPGLDNKTVADPAAQSTPEASSAHLAAQMGSEASAATPQAPDLAQTLVAGSVDPTNATHYAGLADGGSSVGAMGLRIARAMHDGTQTFSIELHPAELGRVDVRVSFHAEGVGVQMTVDRQETYAAFHRDRAALEQQLAQAGINLGSGGLDLRYGAQSRQQLPQQAASTFRAAASADALAGAAQSYATSSDSLVDIIA
jgi:flagellar hook-length control protein FliK